MRDKKGKFLKGTSGNPGGRSKLPEDISEALTMSKRQLTYAIITIRGMTRSELMEEYDSFSLGMMAISRAYLDMDHTAIKIYEDRIYGKARESLDIELPGSMDITFINKTTSEFRKKVNEE